MDNTSKVKSLFFASLICLSSASYALDNKTNDTTMSKIVDEYYPQYCHILESAYGKGMMSEGGTSAIDAMFENIALEEKKALDIGAGLGGVAYYLADQHATQVTCLEINPWMLQQAERRAPAEIQDNLKFVLSTENEHLPFEDGTFDVVYSKGVFCHIPDKQELFKECYRILKAGGVIVINDWLSATQEVWGDNVQRLVELEGLSLFAETIEGYRSALAEAQFKDIDVSDLSMQYAQYNKEIAQELQRPQKRAAFINEFGEQLHKEAIEGYMHAGEAIVTRFVAHKG